jgi:hypothetical protein
MWPCGESEVLFVSKEQLLAEIEDVIKTMPDRRTIRHETQENVAWFGRVSNAIEKWNSSKSPLVKEYVDLFLSNGPPRETGYGFTKLLTLIHQAQSDLRLETLGPATVAIAHTMVFEYFDEIRKIIELAREDLLFVDPYLDAEFVTRYLPNVAPGVTIRLLTREKLATLLPAVGLFAQQTGATVEIRSAPNFHDRFVLVDRASCYQSGSSFKDGAKSSPTTLTQITDAFVAISQTYEDIWNQAQVRR